MIRQEQRHEERCWQRRERNFVMPVSRDGSNTDGSFISAKGLTLFVCA